MHVAVVLILADSKPDVTDVDIQPELQNRALAMLAGYDDDDDEEEEENARCVCKLLNGKFSYTHSHMKVK